MKGALLLFFFFVSISLFSQNKQIDSLKSLINSKIYNDDFYRISQNVSEFYLGKKNDSVIIIADIIVNQPSISKFNKYKYNAYNRKGYAYYLLANYDESIASFQQGLRFSETIKDTLGQLNMYNNIANVFLEKGNTLKALEYYQLVKQKADQNYKFEKTSALASANIAYVQKIKGNFEEAEKNYYESIRIFERLKDINAQSNSYNNLASLMIQKGDYKKAKFYNNEAYNIQSSNDLTAGLAITYNIYSEIFKEENNFQEAINYAVKAKIIYEKQKDIRQLGIIYSSLGSLFQKINKTDSAILFLSEAVKVLRRIKSEKNLATVYNLITKSFLQNEDLNRASVANDSAFYFINKTSNRQELKNYWINKIAIAKKNKDFISLPSYFEEYNKINDSLLNEKNIESMNKLNVQYETEKKNYTILLLSKSDSIKNLQIVTQQLAISKNLYQLTQQKLALSGAKLQLAEDSLQLATQNETILQNQLDASQKQAKINSLSKEALQQKLALQEKQIAINQKNTTIGIIAAIAAVVLLIGYGFYRKKQLEQEALFAAEQAKQREQLTKAVIEAEEAERKRIASDLHDGVGQLFSAVKMNLNGLIDRIDIPKEEDKFLAEKTLALVDESCKEVRVISHKMMPNFLLKSGIASDIRSFIEKIDENTLKINFETVGFKEQLEFNEEVILYRVIQELINNVIKHAKANELHLRLEKNEKQIQLQVADNGEGFDYESAKAKGGLGLKNILVRVEYLKGTIHFSQNKPSGTIVSVHVPIA